MLTITLQFLPLLECLYLGVAFTANFHFLANSDCLAMAFKMLNSDTADFEGMLRKRLLSLFTILQSCRPSLSDASILTSDSSLATQPTLSLLPSLSSFHCLIQIM